MNCKLIKNNLIGFIEGTLSSEMELAFQEHLLHCNACNELIKEVKATYNVCGSSVIPPINPYFYTRLEQKLAKKTGKKASILQMSARVWQPIAAGILIIVAISIGFSLGKQVPVTVKNSNGLTKSDNLNAYASEYYFDGTGEESLDNLVTNE